MTFEEQLISGHIFLILNMSKRLLTPNIIQELFVMYIWLVLKSKAY